MNVVDIIVVIGIALCVCGALAYLVKEKRSGGKCIGCPYARECGKRKQQDAAARGQEKKQDSLPRQHDFLD